MRYQPCRVIKINEQTTSPFLVTGLRRKYVIALLLIACLTVASQTMVQRSIQSQGMDAPIINIAGRQRMLSQKIAKAVVLLQNEARLGNQANVAAARNELKAAVDAFRDSHRLLVRAYDERLLTNHSEQIQLLFEGIEPDLKQIVTSSYDLLNLTALEIDSSHHVTAILAHEKSFLPAMDKIVGELEAQANRKIVHLKYIELLLMIFTLAVLTFECIYIFEPAARLIRQQFNLLEDDNQQKEKTADQLHQLTNKLKTNNELLNAVLSSVEEGIIAANRNGEFLYFNKAAEQILGKPAKAIDRSEWSDFYGLLDPTNDKPLAPEQLPLTKAAAGQRVIDQKIKIRSHDKDKFVSASAWPLQLGDQSAGVVVFRDISKERESQKLKEKLHNQQQLLARQAGMNEVATNVLHNVGNALNTIQVSTNLVRDRLLELPVESLDRALGAIKEIREISVPLMSSRKGQQFVNLLEKIAVSMQENVDDQLEELDVLHEQVQQIESIVHSQTDSNRTFLLKQIDLRQLINEILQPQLNHSRIQIEVHDEIQQPVRIPVFEVRQILDGIIENAMESLIDACKEEPRIKIRAVRNQNQIMISVSDNGVGIAADNQVKLFQHGYSTKAGKSGFTLHSSANLAKQLGGSLAVQSSGTGHGAKFILTLTDIAELTDQPAPVEVLPNQSSLSTTNAEIQRTSANSSLESASNQQHYTSNLNQSKATSSKLTNGILHNVGNVLTSVNISTTMLQNLLDDSAFEKLSRAANLIVDQKDNFADFVANDERGRHFPALIKAIADRIDQQLCCYRSEFSDLKQNIGHAIEIIKNQQPTAKTKRPTKSDCDLPAIVERAIQINRFHLEKHLVKLTRDIGEVPSIRTDENAILQILVNLIKNAAEAMEFIVDGADHELKIALHATNSFVNIDVKDNGIGIAAEQLDLIFRQGYTTRDEGHGFGLHYCFQTASRLGGSLTATSDGIGLGSRFRLQLPINTTASRQHAHDDAFSNASIESVPTHNEPSSAV